MKWDNGEDDKGMRKCWVFHSNIKDALTGKYGEPVVDESTEIIRSREIPSGVKYSTIWKDSTGETINLVITRQTHNMIIAKADAYLVFVIYGRAGYFEIGDTQKADVGSDL